MDFKILCVIILTLTSTYSIPGKEKSIQIDNINQSANWTLLDVLKIIRKIVELWNFDPNYLGLDPYTHTLKFGYPAENHVVQTEDGYILKVLRIPHGINMIGSDTNRPIAYLQPGLLCSAACYTDFGPNRALAYILADAGYDVWIPHPRGTTFSRNHTTYNSMKSKKYWQFSWHEIGTIDVPSTIDYILNVTKQTEVNYIGHSQGTSNLFVMLAEKPEYNAKIKVGVALAPIAFLENLTSNLLKQLSEMYTDIDNLFNILRVYDIFPHTEAVAEPIMQKCNYNSSDENLAECAKWIDFTVGYHQDQIDPRDIALIASHYPAGASTKQVEHYSQLLNNGGFCKFDYGKKKNNQIYGQDAAPSYNLNNINATIYLIYGENDILSSRKDVQKLHKLLPSSELLRVNYTPFSHFDFLYSKIVSDILYPEILKILYNYNKGMFP